MIKLKIIVIAILFLKCNSIFSQQFQPPVSDQNTFASSSYLPPSKVSDYGPENIFDFDQSTAWIEGVRGDGAGEWVAHYLGNTKNLKGTKKIFFVIYPGYQKSRESLSNNGTPISFRITLFIDLYKLFEKVLETNIYEGEQYSDCWGGFGNAKCSFDLPLGFPKQGKVWIKIEILKIRTGFKYKDTAISEVIANFEGASPFYAKEKLIPSITSIYQGGKINNIDSDFFVISEKLVAIDNLSWSSECGSEITLFEYIGNEWQLKTKKYFESIWWGELNDTKFDDREYYFIKTLYNPPIKRTPYSHLAFS